MTGERNGSSITWTQIAMMLAGIAALASAHAYFVVPRVIQESRIEWTQDDSAVVMQMRAERQTVFDALKVRLEAIEARGVRVEDKLDRLIESRPK